MQPAKVDLVTEGEYLARERAGDEKHELVNGRILAMAGASPRHNMIAGNVAEALRARLRAAGKGCLVFPSDQRVHVPATGLYTYPDVTVVCGGPEFHPQHPDNLVNPTLIIEVLSKSTEAWDRGAKFAHYRPLPSLRAYVLVAQSEQRVELFLRAGDAWQFTEAQGDAALAVGPLGVSLPLAAVYENTDSLPGD
jgi:Uma2 family endonuclease